MPTPGEPAGSPSLPHRAGQGDSPRRGCARAPLISREGAPAAAGEGGSVRAAAGPGGSGERSGSRRAAAAARSVAQAAASGGRGHRATATSAGVRPAAGGPPRPAQGGCGAGPSSGTAPAGSRARCGQLRQAPAARWDSALPVPRSTLPGSRSGCRTAAPTGSSLSRGTRVGTALSARGSPLHPPGCCCAMTGGSPRLTQPRTSLFGLKQRPVSHTPSGTLGLGQDVI